MLLVGGGILAYSLLKNVDLTNISPNKNSVIVNPENNTVSLNPNTSVTPAIVDTLQKNIPNLSGSQVTSFIHGGSISGYRGTNGKVYSSYEEALRNGAA